MILSLDSPKQVLGLRGKSYSLETRGDLHKVDGPIDGRPGLLFRVQRLGMVRTPERGEGPWVPHFITFVVLSVFVCRMRAVMAAVQGCYGDSMRTRSVKYMAGPRLNECPLPSPTSQSSLQTPCPACKYEVASL